MSTAITFIKFIVPVLIFILAWEAFSRAEILEIALFPPASRVLKGLIELTRKGVLLNDIAWSSMRAIIGFAAGSALGVGIGILTGRVNFFNYSLTPLIQLFRSIPSIALVPLAIIWFGLGEASKIMLVTWGVFFPVWVNTFIGVTTVDQTYLWAAQSLGASNRRIMFKIILPAALPLVVAGMRVGVALAFLNLVAAEMAGAYRGLGFREQISHMVFRIDHMIAAIVCLGILGASADYGFATLVKKFFPWQERK